MTEFRSDGLPLDEPTLRRIALLVMRASQDEAAIGGPMTEIWNLIDRLKQDAAGGTPFRSSDIAKLTALIDRVTRENLSSGELTVQSSILTELRDVVRMLRAETGRSDH